MKKEKRLMVTKKLMKGLGACPNCDVAVFTDSPKCQDCGSGLDWSSWSGAEQDPVAQQILDRFAEIRKEELKKRECQIK